MDHHFGGGGWMMVPTQSSMSQDHSSLQPQYYQQQQQLQLQQLQLQQHQQQQQQQQQQQHHQSLASHFHLLHMVENLAEAVESGTRDQHSEALINELTNHFEKCQQLLNSISGTITSKAMTVEGQTRKQDETVQLLNQRKDLITKYRNSVEGLLSSDCSR